MDELVMLEAPKKDAKEIVVHVRLIGVLASAAGTRQADIKLVGQPTISNLTSRLVETVGKRQFEELLVDAGTRDPRPNVIILINEQDCNLTGGLKATLQPDSTVTIIPVAHGG